MHKKRSFSWFGVILLLALSLYSCQFPSASPAPSTDQPPIEKNLPQDSAIAETPQAATATKTTVNEETGPVSQQLTICLGQEPQSLFWYGPLTTAARSVLAAIYDGPFDRLNYANQSVILEAVPSNAGGDILFEPVSVELGERIADAEGNLVVLADGVSYRPAGCTGIDCIQVYAGADPVIIDQMVIRYRLKPGLQWSDGVALTADDSLFSFQAARALQPQGWTELLASTWSYQVVDELSLEWRGLPGYLEGDAAQKFFQPLPRHSLEGEGWVNLPNMDLAVRKPMGWGPYQIETWQAGDRIVLTRSPNYDRAGEGLPIFERLVFRFVLDPDQALQDLRSGACDVLDPTAVYETQLDEVISLQAAGEVKVYLQPAFAWEQITFGISPADAGSARVFAQTEVRQAAALCIDRSAIVSQVLAGLAQEATGFFPPGHPDAQTVESGTAYDPQAGMQHLDNVGWRDLDGSSATPRTAQSVPGFSDGAALQVVYLVSPDPDRQAAAQIVQAGLQNCGFAVEISTQPFADYLASGPQGPVFGRSFDLAQFAWPVPAGNLSRLCSLYLSSEIPGLYPEFPRGWGGGNAGGYVNPTYDQACQNLYAVPQEWPERGQVVQQVRQLIDAEVPVLPLYWRFRTVLSRPELCGIDGSVVSSNWLWNLESLRRDPACS